MKPRDTVHWSPSSGAGALVKRAMDITGAAVGLVLLSPLLAFAAIAVKASSAGPILFVQPRLGRGGKLFPVYKFRSMYPGSESVEVARDGYSYGSDPRVTPAGRFLRASSLDELPQLFNVLRGDMSLVGPRPALPHHLARYDDRQRRRLEVKPGITGLAQVKGRNTLSWEERIAFDLEYVAHWSPLFDLKILLQTVFVVFNHEQAAITYTWRR